MFRALKAFIIAFLLIGLGFALESAAQPVKIWIDSANSSTDSTITLSVKVENFTDLLAVQGTIQWDPTLLNYQSTSEYNIDFLNANSFGETNVGNGKLLFLWTPDDVVARSISNGSHFFKIQFEVIGNGGTQAVVSFDNDGGLPLEFADADLNIVTYEDFPGIVNIFNSNEEMVILNSFANTHCEGNYNGSIEASVLGDATNFNFYWYIGTEVKEVPDYVSANPGNLAPGIYTLEVYKLDNSLFAGPIQITIEDQSDIPLASIASVQGRTDCVIANGQIIGQASDETNKRFDWYSGKGVKMTPDFIGKEISQIDSGVYTLQIVDTVTFCVSDTVSVKVNSELTYPDIVVKEIQNKVSCLDDDGSALAGVKVSSDTLVDGYAFEWFSGNNTLPVNLWPDTEGAQNEEAINLPAGIYTLKVLDELNNCFSTDLLTIEDKSFNPTLDLNESIITADYNCNDGISGTGSFDGTSLSFVVDSVEGSTYSFLLQGQSTNLILDSPLFTKLFDGEYTITATNTNTKCTSVSYFFTIVDSAELPVLTFDTIPNTSLNPDAPNGSIEVVHNQNSDTFEYAWFFGAPPFTQSPFSTSKKIENVKDSLYSVRVTNLGTSCQTIGTVNLGLALPIITIDSVAVGPQTHCTSANGNISVLGISKNGVNQSINNYSFELTFSNGEEVGQSYPFMNLEAGAYFIQATENGTLVPAQPYAVVVSNETVLPQYGVDVLQQQSNCNPETPNGSLQITLFNGVEGDFDIAWFDSDDNLVAQDQLVLNNLEADTYKTTLTNKVSGCSALMTTVLDSKLLKPFVQSFLTNDIESCNELGNAEVLIARYNSDTLMSNEATFNWYKIEGNNTIPIQGNNAATIGSLESADYGVEVFHLATECTSDLFAFTIQDNANRPLIEVVELSPRTICKESQQYDGAITIAVNQGESSNVDIRWYQLLNSQETEIKSLQDQLFAANLDSGTYKIGVLSNDNNCSTDSVIHLELQPETIVANLSSTANNFCADGANGLLFATVVQPQGTFEYFWLSDSLDDNTNAFSTMQNVDGLSEGRYYSRVMHIESGCSSETKPVDVAFSPVIPTGTITQSGDTLIAPAAQSNEWLLDGNSYKSNAAFIVPSKSGSYTVEIKNEFNCTYETPEFLWVITTIPDNFSEFKAYPNPFENNLSISGIEGEVLLELYDLNGAVLKTLMYNKGEQWDLGSIPNGVYFIRVKTHLQDAVFKVLKR